MKRLIASFGLALAILASSAFAQRDNTVDNPHSQNIPTAANPLWLQVWEADPGTIAPTEDKKININDLPFCCTFNVDDSATAAPPAGSPPPNPPTGTPTAGDTLFTAYEDNLVAYTWDGTTWVEDFRCPKAGDPELIIDGSSADAAAAQAAAGTPDEGSLLVWTDPATSETFTYQLIDGQWVVVEQPSGAVSALTVGATQGDGSFTVAHSDGANPFTSGFKVPPCPEAPITIPASVDPEDAAAVDAWIAANGNGLIDQVYIFEGSGSASDPDYVWTGNGGGTATNIESPSSGGGGMVQNDQSGSNAPAAPTAPAGAVPPAGSSQLDKYDDCSVLWIVDAGGAWVGPCYLAQPSGPNAQIAFGGFANNFANATFNASSVTSGSNHASYAWEVSYDGGAPVAGGTAATETLTLPASWHGAIVTLEVTDTKGNTETATFYLQSPDLHGNLARIHSGGDDALGATAFKVGAGGNEWDHHCAMLTMQGSHDAVLPDTTILAEPRQDYIGVEVDRNIAYDFEGHSTIVSSGTTGAFRNRAGAHLVVHGKPDIVHTSTANTQPAVFFDNGSTGELELGSVTGDFGMFFRGRTGEKIFLQADEIDVAMQRNLTGAIHNGAADQGSLLYAEVDVIRQTSTLTGSGTVSGKSCIHTTGDLAITWFDGKELWADTQAGAQNPGGVVSATASSWTSIEAHRMQQTGAGYAVVLNAGNMVGETTYLTFDVQKMVAENNELFYIWSPGNAGPHTFEIHLQGGMHLYAGGGSPDAIVMANNGALNGQVDVYVHGEVISNVPLATDPNVTLKTGTWTVDPDVFPTP